MKVHFTRHAIESIAKRSSNNLSYHEKIIQNFVDTVEGVTKLFVMGYCYVLEVTGCLVKVITFYIVGNQND